MKRAPAAAAAKPAVVKPRKPVRTCEREGCNNALKPSKKKFCSAVCRNIVHQGLMTAATTKYVPEFANVKLEEYLTWCEEGHKPTLIPTESSYIVIHNARLPTKESYAKYLKVSHSTIDEWILKYPEFAAAMDQLMDEQRTYLLNNGLAGRYNPQIAKLGLAVNHGMVEKQQMDHTHKFIGIVKHLYQRADTLERDQYGA